MLQAHYHTVTGLKSDLSGAQQVCVFLNLQVCAIMARDLPLSWLFYIF